MAFGYAPASVAAQDEDGGLLKVIGNLLGGNEEPKDVQPMRPVIAKPRVLGNVRVIDNKVGADFANMYTPFVTKVLTKELHFVKKVCQPSDNQFHEIHRAGLLSVARLSKHYEDLQKIRQSAKQWPKPRDQITAALLEKIQSTMDDEAASRYREEISARHQADREAAVGMMLVHIDALLFLTPQQHDDIGTTLDAKWNKAWSDGPRLFMYPQYARLPELHVLNPHLSELQRSLWRERNGNSSVNFGWQMELGLQDWFGGGVDLEPFEKPPAREESEPVDSGG